MGAGGRRFVLARGEMFSFRGRRGAFVYVLCHHFKTCGQCAEGCRDSTKLVGVVILTLRCFIIVV
eukprot:scaffold205032_cov33-Tisochrysis_lutea.AAC.1